MAIWSATLRIAIYTLAAHGNSSAQSLQWQQVRKFTIDVLMCIDVLIRHHILVMFGDATQHILPLVSPGERYIHYSIC